MKICHEFEQNRYVITPESLQQIAELAQSIRFGSIPLVCQDGMSNRNEQKLRIHHR